MEGAREGNEANSKQRKVGVGEVTAGVLQAGSPLRCKTGKFLPGTENLTCSVSCDGLSNGSKSS